MWLEIKAMFTLFGLVFLSIIVALTGNLMFLMLCIVFVMVIIVGDLVLGWKIINTDAINLLDPNGLGERTIILHLIGGGVRVIKGNKGALGKIDFLYRKKKASVIDDGSYPVRFPNGNAGVVAHESYDRNIDYYKTELLKKLFVKFDVDNVKELYKEMKKHERELHKPTSEATTAG